MLNITFPFESLKETLLSLFSFACRPVYVKQKENEVAVGKECRIKSSFNVCPAI